MIKYTNTTGKPIIINDTLLTSIKRYNYGKNKPNNINAEFNGVDWIESTSDFAKRVNEHSAKSFYSNENIIELR